jgi:hypothetical protein
VTRIIARAAVDSYAAGIDTGGAQMLNGDAAKYRVHDMVRSAEGHRAGRPIAAVRSDRRASTIRRVAAATAALLSLPFRH